MATAVAYSGLNGGGYILSQGQNEPFSVTVGLNNQLALTLYGVPHSLIVIPKGTGVSGSAANGFTIGAQGLWGDARAFSVAALDEANNFIIGPGAPTFSVTSTSQSFKITQPTSSSPNLFSVLPPRSVISATTQIKVNAISADPTVCASVGAVCNESFSLTYSPYANDDWIAFAHDFQRTGQQVQDTGITANTVGSLIQRWKVTLPDNVYSSPVVYNGNIIVAAYNGTLYDLSAVDGSVIWKKQLAQPTWAEKFRGSPTIDVSDGLVIVGLWNDSVSGALPSAFFGLRLSDGTSQWYKVLPGLIRAAPVVANGVVYEGWSGGDQDQGCVSGGVTAISAKTGQTFWTWYTNPTTNPGGGGGVWGALAWDGQRLIFGTGNTCQPNIALAQGAVALNADGTTAWSFQADPDQSNDDDTGGGVMLQNGTATFMNKNGLLYKVDASTGQKLTSTAMGSGPGYGGFATPGSDGHITVVGAGYFPPAYYSKKKQNAEHPISCWRWTKKRPKLVWGPGFTSRLAAVDQAGNLLWLLPMASSIDSYVAVNNGVIYAGMDNNMDAINIQTGQILAQFPSGDIFEAGPVVVPSGLYMVDYSGTIQAFSLPPPSPSVVSQRSKPH